MKTKTLYGTALCRFLLASRPALIIVWREVAFKRLFSFRETALPHEYFVRRFSAFAHLLA